MSSFTSFMRKGQIMLIPKNIMTMIKSYQYNNSLLIINLVTVHTITYSYNIINFNNILF